MRSTLLVLLFLSCQCRDSGLIRVNDCGKPCYSWSHGEGIAGCHAGRLFCDDDGGTTCVGESGPGPETCNSVDDDCDRIVDNHLTDDLGGCTNVCGGGVEVCQLGAIKCIGQEPRPEVCNNRDDDCDGTIDNIPYEYCYTGDAGTLGTVCHPGVKKCVHNVPTCVGQQLPTPETCNSIDDDCNDRVDDGISCVGQVPRGLKVQLTWPSPSDIDLHIRSSRSWGDPQTAQGWAANSAFNPSPDGGPQPQWDCFYANKDPIWNPADSREDPHLDIDDLWGPGPETTTIEKMSATDSYYVGVHVYTWKTYVPVMVTVNVYCGGVLLVTRTNTLRDRDFWVVGKIASVPGDPCEWQDDSAVDGGTGGTVF